MNLETSCVKPLNWAPVTVTSNHFARLLFVGVTPFLVASSCGDVSCLTYGVDTPTGSMILCLSILTMGIYTNSFFSIPFS